MTIETAFNNLQSVNHDTQGIQQKGRQGENREEAGRTTQEPESSAPGIGPKKKQGNWSMHLRTHGMSQTRVYKIWCKMKERCTNPNYRWYDDYGGRGITVCDRWLNSFSAFFEDMGDPPTREHSIERKDNSRGYEPGNCCWATLLEQGRNKRNNVILTHAGKSQTLSDWSRQRGIRLGTMWNRIRLGWDDARIITTPLRGSQNGETNHAKHS